jgi:hypothetical protein
MSVAALVSPAVAKEIRALTPVWALCVAGLGGSFVSGANIPLGLIAYGLGVLALGAQSVGHEYSHRTLPLLLVQPVARRRLLKRKAAVLVPMVLTVLAAAAFVFRYAYGPDWAATRQVALLTLALPVLCALLLAPWLTMVCRSALAGVVFSIALPGVIMTLTAVLVRPSGMVSNVRIGAILALCAVGGALGWQRFMRLEAVDAPSGALQLPRILRTGRPHHPLWMLALKELHLQQLTFALVAVYLGVWVALSIAQRLAGVAVPGFTEIPFDVLTPLYLILLTLLIGSLACAEERQYGTLEWQQQLPAAAWRQWMVKVVVVFGLAALFAIALPTLLGWVTGKITGRGESIRPEIALLVVVCTAGSLYISSLCRSTMHAAVLSLAIVPLALAAYAEGLRQMIQSPLIWHLSRASRLTGPRGPFAEAPFWALAAFIVVMLVRVAYLNHRTSERSAESVLRQLVLIAACLAGGSVVCAVAFRALGGR